MKYFDEKYANFAIKQISILHGAQEGKKVTFNY